MHRRFVAPALIAAAIVLAGSACSSGGATAQTDSKGAGAVTAASGVSEPNQSPTTTGQNAAGGSGASRTAPGSPLGTTRAQLRTDPGNTAPLPIRIDIVRLRATGDLIELEMALTNEATPTGNTSKDRDLGFGAFSLFAEGANNYDLSGVGLVDPAGKKVYLPAHDSGDECLCTDGFMSTDFGAGGTYTLTATYGGVPTNVTAIDVRIPNFPAVTGVRIER